MKIRSTIMIVILAAVMMPAGQAMAATETTQPNSTSDMDYVEINGTKIDKILWDGKLIPLSKLVTTPSGVLQLGPEAIENGFIIGFSDRNSPAARKSEEIQLAAAKKLARSQTLNHKTDVIAARGKSADNQVASTAAGCGSLSMARMYENLNCSGSYLSMFKADEISYLGTYGWNDRVTSLSIGYCQSMFYGFKDINFGGTRWDFGQGVYSYVGGSANDQFSSTRTINSGVC